MYFNVDAHTTGNLNNLKDIESEPIIFIKQDTSEFNKLLKIFESKK